MMMVRFISYLKSYTLIGVYRYTDFRPLLRISPAAAPQVLPVSRVPSPTAPRLPGPLRLLMPVFPHSLQEGPQDGADPDGLSGGGHPGAHRPAQP